MLHQNKQKIGREIFKKKLLKNVTYKHFFNVIYKILNILTKLQKKNNLRMYFYLYM